MESVQAQQQAIQAEIDKFDSEQSDLDLKLQADLSDKILYFTKFTEQSAISTLLTYQDLTSADNYDRYRVIDAETGKIVALDESDAQKYDTDASNVTYTRSQILKDDMAFQEAINSGTLIIQKMNILSNSVKTWKTVSLNSAQKDIYFMYYTQNDAKATAEYEYSSIQIHNQKVQKENEKKQLELVQKAIEAEMSSLQKYIDEQKPQEESTTSEQESSVQEDTATEQESSVQSSMTTLIQQLVSLLQRLLGNQ